MTHPGNMTAWPDIACRRGHATHESIEVRVTLGGPTHYADLAPIPERYARSFQMALWDPDRYPVDNGPYCPAHDAVSATVATLGVWEPRETVLALTVLESQPGGGLVDFGAQIGWFSLLAMSAGSPVLAVEADPENLRLLAASVAANGWEWLYEPWHRRIGPAAPLLPARPSRLAKVDVEGAEADCLRVLWPSVEAGLVDHLLVEVSPVFGDGYGALVARLMDAGYDAFLLPDKQYPPVELDDPASALAPLRLERAGVESTVDAWRQENVWFKRRGASW